MLRKSPAALFCAALLPIIVLLPAPSAWAATSVASPQLPVYSVGDISIGAFGGFDGANGFVDVLNNGTAHERVDGYTVTIITANEAGVPNAECRANLSGLIAGESYVKLSMNGDAPIRLGECTTLPAFASLTVELTSGSGEDEVVYEVVKMAAGDSKIGWVARSEVKVLQPAFGDVFMKATTATAHRGNETVPYEPPVNFPLDIVEILPHPRMCTEIQKTLDASCSKYIKFVNNGTVSVDLAAYRVHNDDVSTNAPSGYNTSYITGLVAPGEFLVVSSRVSDDPLDTQLKLDADTATMWMEDYYGTVEYSSDIIYSGGNLAENEGKSWAKFYSDAGLPVWEWATPSPLSAKNTKYVPLVVVNQQDKTSGDSVKPCKDGQYRSEETGRCRNIALAGETLTPCKEGQYRSEETNRCRSIASATDASKPCAEDQFRNPETGRCKKIASTEDALQPCDEGEERNPETNRCRKVALTDMPLAKFPIEPIKQGAESVAAWWIMGGVTLAAVGYGSWEWRYELARILRRAGGTISFSRHS